MRLIRCMWPGLSGSTHSLKPVDSSSCFSRNLGAGSLGRKARGGWRVSFCGESVWYRLFTSGSAESGLSTTLLTGDAGIGPLQELSFLDTGTCLKANREQIRKRKSQRQASLGLLRRCPEKARRPPAAPSATANASPPPPRGSASSERWKGFQSTKCNWHRFLS